MIELLLRPLADAFMEVGVFVGVLIAVFGWVRWRHGQRLLSVLNRRTWAPALGAVLGVSPGCAGAILVMPLYARGSVSFGGAIAALVATMGDSSWVVMAADPSAALTIHTILFATGLATGYAVDALRIAPRLRHGDEDIHGAPPRSTQTTVAAGAAGAVSMRFVSLSFWILTAVGFVLAVPVVFELVGATTLATALGGLDPYLWLGAAGTLVAAAIFTGSRRKLADDSLDAASTGRDQTFSTVLRHGARETSFVIVWVAAIYLTWTLIEHFTGFDGSQLPIAGIVGVLVGATIGLIPGCAVQIVFAGLYVSGVVPFSTLIANAISQDGDALLPLLALEFRSAATATCITTMPGLVVGALTLLLT